MYTILFLFKSSFILDKLNFQVIYTLNSKLPFISELISYGSKSLVHRVYNL